MVAGSKYCGNVGSGSVEEMAKWVEYMTSEQGSPMAKLRKEKGAKILGRRFPKTGAYFLIFFGRNFDFRRSLDKVFYDENSISYVVMH